MSSNEKDTVIEISITEDDIKNYKRLDQFLSEKITDTSRSFLKDLFEKGQITATTKIELKKMPKVATTVSVTIPPPRPADAEPQNIPLEIIFEDEHLVFVNKPAGMVTHPAPGNYDGTLVNAILYHCKDIKGVGDQKRPGIVHRLDKGTSGIMVVAKTQKCHEGLVKLFSTHDIDRYYEAIVMGNTLPIGGKLESTIGRHPTNRLKMAANVRGGKEAITHYKVLDYFNNLSHVELKLETGRTHQIRVHLSSLLNRAILCDPIYGNPKQHIQRVSPEISNIICEYEYPFLHAKILGLVHPITGEKLFFEVEPPQIFKDVLKLAREQRDEDHSKRN
ncbi:RluA family pseudouridine synthase [Bacteriovorax sp. Seq25_V]|uniref:RluA family pseudouridine synthase n=1 Tax=Bacteriovorax sp. Seq25_V TaxID=1201288 RepID=UPI000389F9C3|nr:RluA family pseudouridine synthase [Bacteriovorax sp. Seq25_V]EQC45503.1 pseudouridine synthase, RluA family [Bacteriovorax sp. Seq25_V]